jgi:hypothetical protein
MGHGLTNPGQKRGVPCGGYKKNFKWRAFEEADLTGKVSKVPKPSQKGRNLDVFSYL